MKLVKYAPVFPSFSIHSADFQKMLGSGGGELIPLALLYNGLLSATPINPSQALNFKTFHFLPYFYSSKMCLESVKANTIFLFVSDLVKSIKFSEKVFKIQAFDRFLTRANFNFFSLEITDTYKYLTVNKYLINK